MVAALELLGTERVLELGSATVYPAALLGRLARNVYSIASDADCAGERARTLTELGCSNVRIVSARALTGWAEAAPYQAIFVGAGVTQIPLGLLDQLELGGRMVIPVGDANGQLLELLRKRADSFDSETLGACHFGMLEEECGSPSSFPWTRMVHD